MRRAGVWWPQHGSCLGWGFVLLKDVWLSLKTLLVSTERWLSGCEQLRVGVRFSYWFLLKDTNNNRAGTTFDHSRNPSGFWTSDLQVKGFVPSSVAGELSLLLSSNCRYSLFFSHCLLLKTSMQFLCVTLLSHFDFHTVFLFCKANKMGWEPARHGACDRLEPSPSSLTSFPSSCNLCKALSYGRSDQPTSSCSLSWRSSHETYTAGPPHPLPAFFLYSSYIWTCDFMRCGSIFVITCPKVNGMLRPNFYVIPFFGWTMWCNEQLGGDSALLLLVTALRTNISLWDHSVSQRRGSPFFFFCGLLTSVHY